MSEESDSDSDQSDSCVVKSREGERKLRDSSVLFELYSLILDGILRYQCLR